jgi:hypothetical protein
MVVCAAIVMLIGFLVLIAGLCTSVGALKRAAAAKAEMVEMDTKSIGEELNVVHSKVSSITWNTAMVPATEMPVTNGFPVCEKAVLTSKQRMAFMSYLEKVGATVEQMQKRYIAACDDAMEALYTAGYEALQKKTQERTGAQRSQEPTLKNTEKRGRGGGRLYVSEAFKESDLDRLDSVAKFMSEGIATYTPNKRAQEMGRDAGIHIENILKLIENEYAKEAWSQVQEQLSTKSTPSNKEALIEEYIVKLNYCRETVRNLALKGWKIDVQLEKLRSQLDYHESRINEHVVAERADARKAAAVAILTFVVAYVVALLLLVLRDFLAATIDTATNTGATAVNTGAIATNTDAVAVNTGAIAVSTGTIAVNTDEPRDVN